MHQLTIDKLGPIQHCVLQIKPYTILTGYQAAGKSTIAKSVYFFRTLKEDLIQLISRRAYSQIIYREGYAFPDSKDSQCNLKSDFISFARNKFLSTFGTSYSMNRDMKLSYQYKDAVTITIRLTVSRNSLSPNYVWVDFSPKIVDFLVAHNSTSDLDSLKKELALLFDDPFETVYIPAGRSVLTVLGTQFNYFYSTMDDAQKRLMDSCTRDYLERVMKLRPQFSNGLEGLLEGEMLSKSHQQLYQDSIALVSQILKGKYSVYDGEERIWVDSKHYVKINFASSGQQEVVWILNLLAYYLATQQKAFFIIEEPESNLFPESQKLIIELISLTAKAGNSILLTTHSPYVLGAANNLLYANEVGKDTPEKVERIISHRKWIDSSIFTALFVQNGTVSNCMDDELMQIDNSLLDQISHVVNAEYDSLFEIEQEVKGEK